MSYKFLTVIFNFDSSKTDVKSKVKKAVQNVKASFFVDELANGLKFAIQRNALSEVADALMKAKLAGGQIYIDGKDDELFIVIEEPKTKVNPSTSSFEELDSDRLKKLF